jgi:hypothetical protein
VPDLAIELPSGRRDRYPADPQALNTLMATHGLQAASSRLVEALSERGRES